MQIVIDIPDMVWNTAKEYGHLDICGIELSERVMNGIPLPKGHGSLKDINKIGLTNFECFLCNGDYKEALKMLEDKIKNAPTIIEEDRG